jgi:heme exporter protein A
MTTPGAALRVSSVWKRFGSRDALAGVSLEAPRGSCLALLGHNGSGKTTLLRILSTLWQPTEGDVEVLGYSLEKESSEVRARIGVVLDRHLLPREFSLRDGLRMYADLHAVPDAAARIEALAERLGLARRLRDPVRTFSRGMGQRASICRALLHDPEMLLLDEPFTGLDAAALAVTESVIEEIKQDGRTVVLVTHDLERAARLATHAVVLSNGRKVFEGDPVEAASAAGSAS